MGSNRQYYIDNLRVALTVLVAAHHAAQHWDDGNWVIKDQIDLIVSGGFTGISTC